MPANRGTVVPPDDRIFTKETKVAKVSFDAVVLVFLNFAESWSPSHVSTIEFQSLEVSIRFELFAATPTGHSCGELQITQAPF